MPLPSDSPIALNPQAVDSVLRVGGPTLLRRLVEVAEGNLRQRLDQWNAALTALPADLAAAERAAHSIKSSAAYLGVDVLRQVAEDMETAARDGHTVHLESMGRQAAELLQAALPVLAAEVRRHGG